MKKQISEKVIKSICGVPGNCIYDCNVLVHVKEGKVIKVEGDTEIPYNRGPLCIKGLHAADGIYSPSRLKYPLRRIGEGEQGKWKQISWDEALEIIAKELNSIKEKYGPLSIAGWSGDPPSIHSYPLFLSLFIRSLGSPNLITHTDLCAGHTSVADHTTFGEGLTRYVIGPDIPNTRCILIVGSNLKASAPPQWTHLLEIKPKGAKIIVVDPRLTETAQKADIWLQIKPGTDAALALGMLNIIINRGLYDKEFVEKWTNGSMLIRTDSMSPLVESDILEGGKPWKFTVWDMNNNGPMAMERSTRPALSGTHKITLVQKKVVKCKTAWDLLVERVQEYAPKKVAEITELPQEKIVEGAIIFGKTNPACLIQRQGINHYRNSAQTARAFNILLAVTGNIDVPGGNLFVKVPKGFITNSKIWKDKKFRLTQEIEKKALGIREFPLWGIDSNLGEAHNPSIVKALLHGDPYPIKAMVIVGTNPVVTVPNSYQMWEALKKLEFLVVINFNMTPTAELANIVLPGAHWLELDDVKLNNFSHFISPTQKAVNPVGECRYDAEVLIELASRMKEKGFIERNFIPWRSVREYIEYRLKDTGLSFEDLKEKGFIPISFKYREYEDRGFKTPSGRVELYSTILEKFEYDFLPHYEESRYPQKIIQEYPLILISAREYVYTLGCYREMPWARKIVPDPQVEINPETAAEREIKEDDWVWIKTPLGKIKQRAKVTDRILPNVVCGVCSWWFPESGGKEHGCFESNYNSLISNDLYGSILGNPILKGLPCQIIKA